MTGDQYQKAIDILGMTRVGSARFFGVAPSTPRRWIAGDRKIPRSVSLLLFAMIEHEMDPMDVVNLEDIDLEDRVASR
jgi:hypothetical protein